MKLIPTKEGHLVRLRYCGQARDRFLIKLHDRQAAERRAVQLRELVDLLGDKLLPVQCKAVLDKAAAVQTDREFYEAIRWAEFVKAPTSTSTSNVTTVKALGDQWTSGELHKKYPDQIKAKRTSDDDAQRLRAYVYPVVESKAVEHVTLDDCEAVMQRLPARLKTRTRRAVGQTLVRLLAMAVYPLRLIERSPIPRGFLPKNSEHKAMAYLYPEEDARLLACVKVPLPSRLLWGFLAREGMRLGEALSLTFGDLDLERGAVKLDKNKTDEPRAWVLSPGVANAIKAHREKYRSSTHEDGTNKTPQELASDLVFVDEHGDQYDSRALPRVLRAHLRLAGVARAELHETTAHRMQMRVHDLRGTFVTVALANGRSEAWISDRTGHKSSQMINHYKRTARTLNELQQGDLVPLDTALPELVNPPSEPGQTGPSAGQSEPDVDSAEVEKPNDFAEERGFEPLVALRLRRFSKPLPSTTRPLLQVLDCSSLSPSLGEGKPPVRNRFCNS